MGRVIRIIAGVVIVLLGLAVAGLSAYMIIWGKPRDWSWLWFVLGGVMFALSGAVLASGDTKGFKEMLGDLMMGLPF